MTTALQAAAIAMNSAIHEHGYNIVDQPLYKAFQTAAGLTADGFPGTNTMTQLKTVLATAGIVITSIQVYPWLSKPGTTGYDGVNAPTYASWTAVVHPPAAPGTTTTTASSSSSSGLPPWALVVIGLAAVGGVVYLASEKTGGPRRIHATHHRETRRRHRSRLYIKH